jgi:hypothetical protein
MTASAYSKTWRTISVLVAVCLVGFCVQAESTAQGVSPDSPGWTTSTATARTTGAPICGCARGGRIWPTRSRAVGLPGLQVCSATGTNGRHRCDAGERSTISGFSTMRSRPPRPATARPTSFTACTPTSTSRRTTAVTQTAVAERNAKKQKKCSPAPLGGADRQDTAGGGWATRPSCPFCVFFRFFRLPALPFLLLSPPATTRNYSEKAPDTGPLAPLFRR